MTERNTERRAGDMVSFPVAASTTLEAGKMGAVNPSGYAVEAADSTTVSVVLGRIEATVDNSSGSDGDENAEIRRGVFKWDNDGTGSGMISLPGQVVYVKDDETVSASTGTASVRAGHSLKVDADGVWVEPSFT